MELYMPARVEKAIKILNRSGYEAFAVGGCVRDGLRGAAPHDWDVCTSAVPAVVLECFSEYKTIKTGISHGTVTVLIEGEPIEVTTYRVDGIYSDLRRPDSVFFTGSLREDLARRDFTINAMAYNKTDGLFDFFGGASDLKNKIIRCVGEPDRRFSEDALRILRALRFASVLDFSIEKDTEASLYKNRLLLRKIARERIGAEFCAALLGVNMPDTFTRHREIIEVFIPGVSSVGGWSEKCQRAGAAGLYLPLRLAIVFEGLNIKDICEALRLPSATSREAALLSQYTVVTDRTKSGIKRLLNRVGENAARHILVGDTAVLDEIIVRGECFDIARLAVDGNDLITAGFSGKNIGEALCRLLELVIDEKTENDKEELLKAAAVFLREL